MNSFKQKQTILLGMMFVYICLSRLMLSSYLGNNHHKYVDQNRQEGKERKRKERKEKGREKKEKKGKRTRGLPVESYDMRRVECRAVRSTPASTRQGACHNSPKGRFASTTLPLPPCSPSSQSQKNPPKRLAEWEVRKNPIFPKTSFLAQTTHN